MAEEKAVNKDSREATELSAPICDTPKRPIVAPRTKFNILPNSTNEEESKSLVSCTTKTN